MQGITLNGILAFGDLALSAVNFILAFSLLIYILFHNWRNSVARAFAALLFFVAVVHASDVIILNVRDPSSKLVWLRFQWLGIAFIPAAYLHFTDAVLRSTYLYSVGRRVLVLLSYLGGGLLFLLVASTNLVVGEGVVQPPLVYFQAGPVFWLFAIYFFAVTSWGVASLFRARSRTLTPASRRRMTYLAVSFAAPALGAFPYLLLASLAQYVSSTFILGLTLTGSMGMAIMTVVMAYSVAYQGVLLPDRVVKRNLINYLLRGPVVAGFLVVLMLAIPRVERVLGLPRDTALVFVAVVGLVFLQALVGLLRPLVDLLVYRRDRGEIVWMRELDERLMTSGDLDVLLENILNAACDLLQAKGGFVLSRQAGGFQVEAVVGSGKKPSLFLQSIAEESLGLIQGNGKTSGEDDILLHNGYLIRSLRTKSRDTILGILAVEGVVLLSPEEKEKLELLVEQAELALEDWQVQRGIFQVLWQMDPEIRSIRRWQSIPRYAGAPALAPFETSPIYSPDFLQAVKDALAHYWGGPKLAGSPLLELWLVRRAVVHNGNLPVPALRSVLLGAIQGLKPPEGERSLNTKEWVLYNILEMKFIRGMRIREIAQRLALSESDLYRKQRAALEAVARVLSEMEKDNLHPLG